MTPSQEEQFAKNPRFIGLKFPNLKHPETLEKHYIGKMGPKAISLMSGMLKMDPKERLTAIECLAHSYFDSIRETEITNLIEEQKSVQQTNISLNKTEGNRSKDFSRRNTSTDKTNSKQMKNPYSLGINGASPPQPKNKKKYLAQKLQKDKKSSNSIKSLLPGRSSSKDFTSKRNIGMSSYDNTAYSMPKNRRNLQGAEVLRENQSMSNYIPASFNGIFIKNMKNAPDATEYDYEIGGEFSSKPPKQPNNKLDNSMGLPSQIYGTDELKNSLSTSISAILSKGRITSLTLIDHRKIPSLSPSDRSEENKSGLK